MLKAFVTLALILISIHSFAGGSWKRSDYHTVETAKDIVEYRALRAKYPGIFIQEIDEARFHSARVESFGWIYIGNTICEPNDPRLETVTHKSRLCMESGLPVPLCALSMNSNPRDVDPCLN